MIRVSVTKKWSATQPGSTSERSLFSCRVLVHLSVFLAAIFLLSCNKPPTTTEPTTKQYPDISVDVCSLLQTPDQYDSKTIRVRAVLIGYHQLTLYSDNCENQVKYIRADTNSNARKQLIEGAASLNGAGMKDGNFWVEVIAVGRFEKIPDCTPENKDSGLPGRFYVNYCYRIAIENIERVDRVPKSVRWPT